MLDTGLLQSLESASASMPAETGKSKPKRLPLSKGERRRVDVQLAERLLGLGREPLRSQARVFQDIEIEPGRVFRPAAYRERSPFAGEGGKRAARTSAEFDLFKSGHDLADIRHFILRPRPAKPAHGAVRIAKAGLGDLAAELERFAADYNRFTKRLVEEGLLRPLLTVVHVRFDRTLQRWDIHAHCVWAIASNNLDNVFRRIGTKFSKPWYDKNAIKNPAALVNYVTQWVIDHRELKHWPDVALLELWDLERPRFIRPAGQFAAFRQGIAGCTLDRRGDLVTPRPKQSRSMGYEAPYGGSSKDGVVGYVRLRLDGQSRLCAVWVTEPERVASASSEPSSPIAVAQPALEASGRESGYSTTSTGLTLPQGGRPTRPAKATRHQGSPPPHDDVAPMIPYRKRWWYQAWPYGGPAPVNRLESPRRLPRPIQRRIERLLEARKVKGGSGTS
ncbi:hypothetical protein [Bosea caraganae]|uniref:hypothetical protein n=1 Tax=Bosea caraganae TaxID=2763117 RepID=UPI0011C06937|nr:hypothetical protein [Bosea caraganae]